MPLPQVGRRATARHGIEPGLIATALPFAAYLLWIRFAGASDFVRAAVTECSYTLMVLVGLVWSLWGARTRGRRASADQRDARSPNLLSLGLAVYFVGDLILAYYRLTKGVKPASSCADLFLLGGAVVSVAGLLSFPSRLICGVVRARVFLDSLMVMVALVTFSWFFTLGPTVLDSQSTPLGKALNAVYPMMDLVMMFCVVASSSHSGDSRLRRSRNLLCGAVLAIVVSDVAFLYLTIHQKYAAGSLFDVGYIIAPLLSGNGVQALRNYRAVPAATFEDEEPETQRPTALWRALLPYALVPAVALLAFHVWSTHVQGELAIGIYLAGASLTFLILVRQVIAIVENNRLYGFLHEAYRELQASATTDGMTGLWNHRTFQERFRAELSKSEVSGEPVSLLLIDVDRFKAYNDQFGHPAGDEALRLVAGVLKASARKGDLPARYGGEEFAAILPRTGAGEATAIAERIRAACEAQAFPCRAVTLSVGIVTRVGGEAGNMIEAADQALYVAKNRGRNTVCREGETCSTLPSGWCVESAASSETWLEEILAGPAAPALRTMTALLSLRDESVVSHSDRAARMCLRLAEESVRQGKIGPSDVTFSDLYLGALLHDIGKVGAPDHIIHAPDALDDATKSILRLHPAWGAGMLAGRPEFTGAVPVVRSHHERWDGAGYPDGLAGEAIPLGARLFAVADAVDAMWSGRSYRAALDPAEIEREVRREAGRRFDPKAVEVFLSIPLEDWEAFRSAVPKPVSGLRRAA